MAGLVVPPVDDEGFAADSFFEPEPESLVDLVDSDLLSDDLLSEDEEAEAGASAAVAEARLSVR